MPRKPDPQAKCRDPEYIAMRNQQVRHRDHAQVSIRVPDDTLARWHAAAAQHNQTLKDWVVSTLDQTAREILGHSQ